MGFLDVDKLCILCRSTQWETFKIWQAVKGGDLVYTPVTYMRQDTSLKDAFRHMLTKNSKFAVVKKDKREVGMIGEQRLKEALNRHSPEYSEETKDHSFYDQLQNKYMKWKKPGHPIHNTCGSKDNSRDSSNIQLNRISKDRFGNDLSRISMNVEALNSIDSQERKDLESCGSLNMNQIEESKSQFKTEASQVDRNEKYQEVFSEKNDQ